MSAAALLSRPWVSSVVKGIASMHQRADMLVLEPLCLPILHKAPLEAIV
jgi:hypothetical protein